MSYTPNRTPLQCAHPGCKELGTIAVGGLRFCDEHAEERQEELAAEEPDFDE